METLFGIYCALSVSRVGGCQWTQLSPFNGRRIICVGGLPRRGARGAMRCGARVDVELPVASQAGRDEYAYVFYVPSCLSVLSKQEGQIGIAHGFESGSRCVERVYLTPFLYLLCFCFCDEPVPVAICDGVYLYFVARLEHDFCARSCILCAFCIVCGSCICVWS